MTTKRHEKLFLIYNIFPAIEAENVHIPFIPRCSPFNIVFYGVLCLAPHQLIASGYRGAPALDRGAHILHFYSTPYGSARPGSDSFCCTQPTKDRCRPLRICETSILTLIRIIRDGKCVPKGIFIFRREKYSFA